MYTVYYTTIILTQSQVNRNEKLLYLNQSLSNLCNMAELLYGIQLLLKQIFGFKYFAGINIQNLVHVYILHLIIHFML